MARDYCGRGKGLRNAFVLVALAAATLCGAVSAQAQDPVKVRVSWVAVPNNTPPFMFKKPGIAKHNGKSYTLEAIQYRGTPQSITALAIQNANMQDLRLIADEFQDGADGYYSAEFMVLKDGPIKKIEDLKGKVVAVNVKFGATYGAVRSELAKHGLSDGDYTVLEVAFSNMR